MVTAFEDFTLYLALDLSNPGVSNAAAASTLKITNDTWNKLVYGGPVNFVKRVTDNSNAQNIDKSSPDTGSALNQIELLIREDRSTPGSTLLKNLLKMHFQKSDTTVFRKGRFGLLLDDNPELNVLPDATGGYKFSGFTFHPDKDNPATQVFSVKLDYVGDHTILDAFN